MEIRFNQNSKQLSEPLITVEYNEKNKRIENLIEYISKFRENETELISIKSGDQILIININKIDLIDVENNKLYVYTEDQIIETNERLINIKDKIGNNDFVQVSKHALININSLISLSSSFSGNMMAKLKYDNKASVSRRYVSNLTDRLGI